MSGIGPGYAAWKLSFQLSPIILTNGIASFMPGGMLPIIAITEAVNFTAGLLSGPQNINLDNFFANFAPLPGGTLQDNSIGGYPFANQSVAANAIIVNPLKISMLMYCPARNPLGYAAKLATMMALKAALDNHKLSGGTYIVATGSNFYPNCIMTNMSDASGGESKQTQNAWRLDFEQPLLTADQLQQAQGQQNALMSEISSGTQVTTTSWSGLAPTVGVPQSLAGPSIIPALSGASGGGVAAVGG